MAMPIEPTPFVVSKHLLSLLACVTSVSFSFNFISLELTIMYLLQLDNITGANQMKIAVSMITAIHNISLVIYRMYHLVKAKSKAKQSSKSKTKTEYNIIECLSLMSIIFAVLWDMITIVSSFGASYCEFLLTAGSILYLITKISLYFLYLERLFHVFHNSAYAFSKSTVWLSRIALISYALAMTLLSIFHGSADIYYHSTHKMCIATPVLWIVATITLVDFVLGVIISILFIRRLLIILTHTVRAKASKKTVTDWNGSIPIQTVGTRSQSMVHQNVNDKRHNQDTMMDIMMQDCNTWKVLQKFTLLTVLAITTTLTSLVFAVLFGVAAVWISIDMMINGWCVILMFHSHHGLYKKMCMRLQKCAISRMCLTVCACNCCCCKIKAKKEESEMVDRKITDSTMESVKRKESIVMDVIDDETKIEIESIERVPTTTIESNASQASVISTQSVQE